jgi:hypothetical protein
MIDNHHQNIKTYISKFQNLLQQIHAAKATIFAE